MEPFADWYERRGRLGRSVGSVGLVLGCAAVLAVTAVVGPKLVFGNDTSGTGAFACTPLTATVVASPDHAPVLQKLAADWGRTHPRVGAKCAAVQVVARSSAEVSATLGTAANSAQADAWAPDSSVWAALAATRPEAAAVLPQAGSPNLAVSPVVIAVPRARASALGWPKKQLSWRELLGGLQQNPTWAQYGHPEWGRFILGMSNPERSTPALHTLLALSDVNGDGTVSQSEVPSELTLERSVGMHLNETDDLFSRVAKPSGGVVLSAFPATEQQVLAFNKGNEGTQLVPIYPGEGIGVADHPFLLLHGETDREAAAKAFRDYVIGNAGRQAYAQAGFRDRDGTVKEVPDSLLASPLVQKTMKTRPLLGAQPTAQVLIRWKALRYPANVLAAIDTSGSMLDPAPGATGTKLDVFKAAAAQSVRLFNSRSRLGVWSFSSKQEANHDYKTVVPVRTLSDTIGGVSQRDILISATSKLSAKGATGLYDTILAGYTEMQRIWSKDRQNILVVLTDGKNEDKDGIDLAGLVSRLGQKVDSKKPITVMLMAYGIDADVRSLSQVARVTAGRVFVCRNPNDIGKVLLAAMITR